MLGVFRDAGLSPQEAAELLHILSACVVGFGFATLWGRQVAAAQEAAAAAGEPAPAPPDLGDLAEYVEAIRRWDPAQFATAVDIVLDAYEARRATARKSGRGPLLLDGDQRDAELVLERP